MCARPSMVSWLAMTLSKRPPRRKQSKHLTRYVRLVHFTSALIVIECNSIGSGESAQWFTPKIQVTIIQTLYGVCEDSKQNSEVNGGGTLARYHHGRRFLATQSTHTRHWSNHKAKTRTSRAQQALQPHLRVSKRASVGSTKSAATVSRAIQVAIFAWIVTFTFFQVPNCRLPQQTACQNVWFDWRRGFGDSLRTAA